MRKSLKPTYRKLLSHNPSKARRQKIELLTTYKNMILENSKTKKLSRKAVR